MTSILVMKRELLREDTWRFLHNEQKSFSMKTRPSPFLSNPSVTNRKFHWRHSIFEYPAISSSTCLFRSLTVSIKIITELFDRRRKRIIGEQPAIGFIDRFIFSSYSFSTWILDRRKIFHPVVIFCSPLDWLQEEWGGNWLSIDLSFFFPFLSGWFVISRSLSLSLATFVHEEFRSSLTSVELNRNYEHTTCFDLKIKYLKQIGISERSVKIYF